MSVTINMPRLGTNDDYVTICKLLVSSGEYVKKGQPIAILETAKETQELTSPAEGYINFEVEAFSELPVGSKVGAINHEKINVEQASVSKKKSTDPRKYTKKALALIEKYSIDVSTLPTDHIIKESDIRKIMNPSHSELSSLPNTANAPIKPNEVLIYGGGGCCKIVVDILKLTAIYIPAGILDRRKNELSSVSGIPVVADSSYETALGFFNRGYKRIINAVIFNGKKHGRKEPYEMLKSIGFQFINVIHKSAIIEQSARIGEGNLIAAGAIIGSDAIISNNCIVNAGAIISHDCIIGDSSHIASGAVLGGNVKVGENTLIGQGVSIFKDINIGKNVVIHNGTHVFNDVPDNSVVTK